MDDEQKQTEQQPIADEAGQNRKISELVLRTGSIPPESFKVMTMVDRQEHSGLPSDPITLHRRNSLDEYTMTMTQKANLAKAARSFSTTKPMIKHSQPLYGADWNLKVQPLGTIEFIHWDEDKSSNTVVITEFMPGLEGGFHRAPEFRKKQCPYHENATPEEAGFVPPPSKLLGELTATAICGNDITSSIIYTAGLVAGTAGYYTPLCLFMVVCLLHFFRSIYVEVVTGLPLNGGTYTAILNTTRKSIAIIAACLSFLSYAATVVVSANSAMAYLEDVWKAMNIEVGTIIVILIFAALMLVGIRESAIVALVIFCFHMFSLLILIGCSIAYAFHTNWAYLVQHYRDRPGPSNPVESIVLGFCTAMLGITGFESSANFVQHQAKGVFSKTLRNMWLIVAVVNPLVSVLGFAVVPHERFYVANSTIVEVSKEVTDSLLAFMAQNMSNYIGGNWLRYLIIVDAITVLCGAVLTGYVGVEGLLTRMVHDDIFPRAFTAALPVTGATYPVILFFCSVCVTLVVVTEGDMASIAGVYTICFLCVMFLFCFSNLVMKHTRSDMKRDEHAKWYVVMGCMGALILALVGNCVHDPSIIGYAALYISVFMTVFYCMFARTFLIRVFLNLTERYNGRLLTKFRKYLIDLLLSIEQVPVVFFSRRLNIREMNVAVQRVIADELTRRLTIVHFYKNLMEIPDDLTYNVGVLDTDIYPNIRIDVILIKGKLGPGTVRLTECILGVPPNRMFIAAPSKEYPYNVAQLGSVRIIMSRRNLASDLLETDGSTGTTGANGVDDVDHAPVDARFAFRNRIMSMSVVEGIQPGKTSLPGPIRSRASKVNLFNMAQSPV